MLQGRNNVIEFIRLNDTAFWYLRRSEKSEPVFTSGDKDITIDESITRLNRCMDMLGTGTYFIEAWSTDGQKKMRNKDSFTLGNGNESNQPISGFQQPIQDNTQNIHDAVAVAIDKLENKYKIEKLETRIKELEHQNKELNSEIDSWEHRVLGKLTPHIGSIIDVFGLKPKNIPISGVEQKQPNKDTPENMFTDQEALRLNSAFEKWSKNENEYVAIVEKIADMAENDTETYSIARIMLLTEKEKEK